MYQSKTAYQHYRLSMQQSFSKSTIYQINTDCQHSTARQFKRACQVVQILKAIKLSKEDILTIQHRFQGGRALQCIIFCLNSTSYQRNTP